MDVRSDTQIQDLERTHPRNNESGAGFQKDHRAKIELIRACDEERWRTPTEESVESRHILGKRKRGRPKIRWKDAIQRDLEKYWIESERGDILTYRYVGSI